MEDIPNGITWKRHSDSSEVGLSVPSGLWKIIKREATRLSFSRSLAERPPQGTVILVQSFTASIHIRALEK